MTIIATHMANFTEELGRVSKWLKKYQNIYVDYNSVTSSAASAVTEALVENNGRPVDFPDFTKGKWKERTPIFIDV